ncbi:MAG: CheR family methyltransferase [Salinivirgaceae bacterium]|jgi:chemotaxis protein methyltransferase CheR|nr:methyltransferase domain-containing protein [Bacteroidales bacterium]
MDIQPKTYYNAQLSDKDFDALSSYIYGEYGIKMPYVKKVMLQSRLQKRLKELNLSTFKEYIEHVFGTPGSEEVIHMMDVVSTNKTDFFREPAHFDFMRDVILPEAISNNQRNIKIWSAGSSSGEEAYTIAFTINEFNENIKNNSGIDYQIIGTDISTIVLKAAIDAVYKEDKVEPIPMSLRRKYFLKSKDPRKNLYRVIPQVRSKVKFGRMNLMDSSYSINETFDIIFCRNTLIYFDRETQENVINKLCRHLRPKGYFFLGHSESITNMNVPLKHIKPTIFQKDDHR